MAVYEQVPIPSIAVIIPLLNEERAIPRLIESLTRLKIDECVFVDGGSTDTTVELLSKLMSGLPFSNKLVHTSAGRALQMNAGALNTQADYLVFLHADSYLPENLHNVIHRAEQHQRQWGRFDVQFYDDQDIRLVMKIVAFFINLRSRLSSIVTGDQAMFVARDLFTWVGQFPAQPLMEDVALSQRLKTYSVPFSAKEKVATSARRWQQNGVFKTIIQMWRLRLAYFFGVPAHRLADDYKNVR